MNKRSFSKNSLITFLSSLFVFFLGFFTLIIISRILGPEGKGMYSLILLVPGIIIAFGSFGIGAANGYFTGSRKYKVEDIIANSIFLSLLLGFLAILIFWFLFQISPFQRFVESNKIVPFYLWIIVFTIPFSFLIQFLNGVIGGKQKIGTYNIIRVIGGLLQLMGVVIFLLLLKRGLSGALFAYIFSILGTALLSFFFVKKIAAFSFKINKSLIKDSFLYGGKIYLANALSFLNYRLDMFLIAIFLNPLAVGIYSIAVGLSEKLFIVSGAFSTVLFPKISSADTGREEANNFSSKVSRHTFFLFFILAILLIILSYPLIFIFFGKDFLPAVVPLIILMPGIIAFGIGGVLSADLAGRGKPHFAIIGSLVCLIINIPLNILFIPRWGISGAALASAIGYWADTAVIIIAFSKISKKPLKEILLIKKQDFQDYFRIFSNFKSWVKKT